MKYNHERSALSKARMRFVTVFLVIAGVLACVAAASWAFTIFNLVFNFS